jgi:hypothetical protein
MKYKLKMILLSIAIALALFLGFGFYKASKLTNIEIVTTTVINAPKDKVFGLVKNFKEFPKWSPFLVQDPSQQYELKGTDGTVGSQYHWVGNKGKDVGYQEITKIDEQSFVSKRCDIQKPFVAKPTFDYYFSTKGNTVEVKEVFKLQSKTMDAFFLWLFGAKAEMIKTNQQGLDLLKAAAEKL